MLVWLIAAAAAVAVPDASVTTIFAAEKSAALKPQVDAQVAAVPVSEGARVTRGSVIIQLDDRQQRARVALAATSAGSRAEVNAAAIRDREAAAKLANAERAAKTGAIADWELRQAQATAAQATQEARMASDRHAVEGHRLAVEQTVLDSLQIRAPFDGRVTRLNARPGASVRPADTVAIVTDLRMLRAEAYVPARLYPMLKVGGAYSVEFAGSFARPATATLIYIDPVLDAGSFRVVFRLRNDDEHVPSGLEGRIILKHPA